MTAIDETFVQDLLARMGDWFSDDDRFRRARTGREYYPYTELFSPIRVNRIHLKNRVVMGPMGNVNMAEEFGRPSHKMIHYFVERARGGVGLITSGLVPVGVDSDPTLTERDGRTYFRASPAAARCSPAGASWPTASMRTGRTSSSSSRRGWGAWVTRNRC